MSDQPGIRDSLPPLPGSTNKLDTRLAADCTRLGELDGSYLLQMDKTSLPWLILVPDTEHRELFELPVSQQQQLTEHVSALSACIKQTFGADKINIAAIGNLVSQLHIHIVGRYRDDFCWPGVVWGASDDRPAHHLDPQLIVRDLQRRLGPAFRPCI